MENVLFWGGIRHEVNIVFHASPEGFNMQGLDVHADRKRCVARIPFVRFGNALLIHILNVFSRNVIRTRLRT